MVPEIDLLAIDRGSVSAPAGCGKTHVIAAALIRHTGTKPVLVLTHTNSGVMALKGRLDRVGVPKSAYRLSTLDAWAIRLISTFPARSGHDPEILQLRRPNQDYPTIRLAAARLLQSGHLTDVLSASYDRLLVDEYQDCLSIQHALVGLASRTLRTVVLGDPLQAIFGFAGKLADWEADVRTHFPPTGELSTPWRWINVGERAFGDWLLDVRRRLLASKPIDLGSAPPNVTWVQLGGPDDYAKRLAACRVTAPSADGGVLIIAGSMDKAGQRRFAGRTPGAVTVESVDLGDLVAFARRFDIRHPSALAAVVEFAAEVMTDIGAGDFLDRVQRFRSGQATGAPSDAEAAALAFLQAPGRRGAVNLLVGLNKQGGVRSHRPAVLSCCIQALNACADDVPGAFADAAVKAREEHRALGRVLPKRAVGSTLLLKGLEAEVAVILDAESGEMNPAHLYVAMTRGSKRLVICSRSPTLSPRSILSR